MPRIGRTVAVLAVTAMLALAALVPVVAASSDARPLRGAVAAEGGVVPDTGCPIGLRTLTVGRGTLAHLGLVSMTTSHCTPNPPFGNPPGPILGGVITIVAANGDTLTGTYYGTVDPLLPVEGARISGDTPVTFTGGTGRFADATGTVDMAFEGVLSFTAPMTMTFTLDGKLGY